MMVHIWGSKIGNKRKNGKYISIFFETSDQVTPTVVHITALPDISQTTLDEIL